MANAVAEKLDAPTVHKLHNVHPEIRAMEEAIRQSIANLARAERVTRKELASLSRNLLVFVMETGDIDYVNRTLSKCTPVNKKAAIEFFKAMLPWEVEKDGDRFLRFGKRMKNKNKLEKKKTAAREAFLKEPENTIWTWADKNIQVKVPDYLAIFDRALDNAAKGNAKKGVEPTPVLELVEHFFQKIPPEAAMAYFAAKAEMANTVNGHEMRDVTPEGMQSEPVATPEEI